MTLFKSGEPLSKNQEEHITIKNEANSNVKSNRLFNLIAYTALLVISIVIFTPLISKLSTIGYDYITHLKWASEMEENQKLILPHPLYHLLVILGKNILPIDYIQSSTVVIVLSIFFLAVLNYRILNRYTSIKTAILFSTCLLLVTPIQLFYFIDNHLYFGYIGISIYHSPTMLLLKPLSLIAFCYALKSATSTSKNDLPSGIAFALSLFFCGISKPNFLMIILPAFIVFLFLIRQLKPTLKHTYIYGAFFLPIITVLSLQFFQTYFFQDLSQATGNMESHIAILPFETMSYYSGFLIPKFFLSIAFPLFIFLCYPKKFIKDKAIIFSSCCFFMGIILTYFFAESGYRMYDGNFWWSGQIGLYLVFLFSLAFLFENIKELTKKSADKIKYFLCLTLFFLHTAFGVFFYRQELLFSSKFW